MKLLKFDNSFILGGRYDANPFPSLYSIIVKDGRREKALRKTVFPLVNVAGRIDNIIIGKILVWLGRYKLWKEE